MTASLTELLAHVSEVINKDPYFRRLPGTTRYRLSLDVCLVGSSIRSGCLIDTFVPKDPPACFSRLLTSLRNTSLTREVGIAIVHLFDPDSNQSFLVNQTRVRRRLSGQSTPQGLPLAIKLVSPNHFELLPNFPVNVLDALSAAIPALREDAAQEIALSASLAPGMDMTALVPLAAFLLDYEVAYVPFTSPGESQTFLSNIPVSTYEVLLRLSGEGIGDQQSIPVMKFSSPQELEHGVPQSFSPATLKTRISAGLRNRLEDAGDATASVVVLHETAVFDRLAL